MKWQLDLATFTFVALICGQVSIELLPITAAIGQTVGDDTGEVCWNEFGKPIECRGKSTAFPVPPDNPSPQDGSTDGGSRARTEHRGSGRKEDEQKCRQYGDRRADPRRPKCPITSLPSASDGEKQQSDRQQQRQQQQQREEERRRQERDRYNEQMQRSTEDLNQDPPAEFFDQNGDGVITPGEGVGDRTDRTGTR